MLFDLLVQGRFQILEDVLPIDLDRAEVMFLRTQCSLPSPSRSPGTQPCSSLRYRTSIFDQFMVREIPPGKACFSASDNGLFAEENDTLKSLLFFSR